MSERRLLAVVGTIVFVDTMFYAVIAPLLPALAHQLHLTRLSAGVLTASYAAGVVVGSLPGGMLAARSGPRFTVCIGLGLLGCSTVGFAWLQQAAALDATRFLAGLGSACSWAGGIAWIVSGQPQERRGAMIGKVLGAGIAGSLLGPAIGAIATATGRPALFTAIAVLAGALIVAARMLPERSATSSAGTGSAIRALGRPPVLGAMWLMALPAIVSGIVNVLAPLRLHQLGAAAGVIGAIFLVGAGIEAALSPLVGGLSDRHGRLMPLRGGLLATTVVLACFALPATAGELGVLVVAVATALGFCWAPAMAMVSDRSEALGLDDALAAALMNLAWACGQIVGGAGGGALARAAGDRLPTGAAAGLCLATLVATGASRRTLARRVSRPRSPAA